MGKTSLAMNISENVAIAGKSVLVFSVEMQGKSLMDRSVCSLSRLDFDKYRKGNLHDDDWVKITKSVQMLNDSKLLIDDTSPISVLDMRVRARRVNREHGLDLIVIDYLQLLRGQGNGFYEQITSISQDIKAMAKEFNIPVLCLAQLSRTLEQRGDKRPIPSDLKESGGIEQDADVIMFPYRDVVYNDQADDRFTELLIRKQRNGRTGYVPLEFFGEYCRFESSTRSRDQISPPPKKFNYAD